MITPLWTTRGAWRAIKKINSWRKDEANQEDYRRALESTPAKYSELRKEHDDKIRQRTGGILVIIGMIAVALTLAEWFVSAWVWAALAVPFLLATIAGKPEQKHAITTPGKPSGPITPNMIRDALTAAIPAIAAALKDNPAALTIETPARDGKGTRVRAELPPGITADMVAAQQPKLASALRRPTLAITVEPDPAHNGMIVLWIGDGIPTGDVEWPLAHSGAVDVLGEFPVGVDIRGRQVGLSLMNQNGLIGAQPGYGKTATLRMVLLAAALDPRVHIYAFDLKGGVDLLPLEPVAECVIAGDEPEDLEELRDDLRAVRKEIRRRNKHIRALPVAERPDGQITSGDASRLGFAPIVFAIDEAQIAFADKTYGKEIEELTEDVFRRGRSVGVCVLLATQRFDTASVPRSVSTNATLRMCGRVDSFQESNMILGSNAHGAGMSATVFGPEDRGVMWVKGHGAPRIVRMARVSAVTARGVVERAARARTARPAAPAPAPDPKPTIPAHDLTERLRHVWPDGQVKVWSETLIAHLQAEFPGDYDDWGPGDLARFLGVKARQVNIGGVNRRGYAIADLPQQAAA